MKRLAILTLLASPAFANQVRFNDLTFLKLTNGDPVKAQELFRYCQESAKQAASCAASLGGSGNLSQEAARSCYNKSVINSLQIAINSHTKDIPGSRMHKAEGTYWHTNYVKSPESGRLHRHAYSDRQKDEAYWGKLTFELNQAKSRMDAVADSSTLTKEKGTSISYTVEAVIKMFTGDASVTQSEAAAIALGLKIPDGEIDEAMRKANIAKNDPSTMNIEPEILCYIDERDCTVGSNSKVSNSSYDPNYKESNKEDKEDKKDEKKGAENPPKHEDDHTSDIPGVISSDGGDLWAGNDTTTPDTVIATPVMDDGLATKSAMEKCVEKESKRLNDEFGKRTIDPNSSTAESDKEKQANDLLRHGYCDAEVLGRDFCREHKFQKDSVVAIDIVEERKEAAKAALGKLLTQGKCDSYALGTDFCKKNAEKWLKTPITKDAVEDTANKNPLIPSRSPNAARINP